MKVEITDQTEYFAGFGYTLLKSKKHVMWT